MVSVTPRPIFIPGKDPVPIVQEAGWAPGPVWTVAENLSTTGFRHPDRSARSESLYRLSYPADLKELMCSNLLYTEDTNRNILHTFTDREHSIRAYGISSTGQRKKVSGYNP